MSEPQSKLCEDVGISVERMIRFCYLAKMLFEYTPGDTKTLPLHLTRFGTLLFETASFLYSLFEDKRDSINLSNVWRGFDHPFGEELQDCVRRLGPFKEELRFVRNRVGFHGSLNRSRERSGLGIFDVDSSRAHDFARLIGDMRKLFLHMIEWYMKGMDESARPGEMWKEFVAEMKGHSRIQKSA
jgi:hypothetical protein